MRKNITSENIHDTQERQMAWVALDDIDRCAVVRMKEKSRRAKAEALLAMSQYLKQTFDSPYATRMRGVAQGMIQTCYNLDVFTQQEFECLLGILKKHDDTAV